MLVLEGLVGLHRAIQLQLQFHYMSDFILGGSKISADGNLKGNQPWIFIGKTDAEAEAPILWPPDAKSRFIGKDPDSGKD